MFTFYYEYIKTFDKPGPNQPQGAITEYYRAKKEEHDKLVEYVSDYYHQMLADFEELPVESKLVYGRELKKHRKKDKTFYTVADAIIDLYTQITTGKYTDPSKSTINRWNSAFCELNVPDAAIITKRGERPSVKKGPKIPTVLFDEFFETSK